MLTASAARPTHQLANFDSGVASLGDWLKRRALQNHSSGGSRTFIVCKGTDVMADYALAAVALTYMHRR